ncbi:ABC transporter permease [Lactiplantibacillus plantarum]|nr:ABC transporter permease [Lactiplantibacillus plantarum]MCG0641086.1 ABC transporter permease [Lactiplantibacillus plantarum]MCG0644061.1 ABC transporter permease [Lactiplantibacillus plantarum]MCG0647138.1 ABC transporter permease [Lactiplantibacillus plantarum]MCG0653397.1 ABC transporter permease [Lactiplantibacillus plantarum]
MQTNIMMELYKFWHQKTPYYGALALLGLMSYSAMTTKVSALQLVFEFGAVQWIVIILIAVGSAFLRWSIKIIRCSYSCISRLNDA